VRPCRRVSGTAIVWAPASSPLVGQVLANLDDLLLERVGGPVRVALGRRDLGVSPASPSTWYRRTSSWVYPDRLQRTNRRELEAGALEPDRVDAPGSRVRVDCEQALGRAGSGATPVGGAHSVV
jgi:hypothetical protein